MFPDNVGTKIRNFEKPDRVRNDERKFKLICTNDVSVRTNRTELIQKSISKMVDFFFCKKSS